MIGACSDQNPLRATIDEISLAALQLGAHQSQVGPAVASLDLPDNVAEFMRLHTETGLFAENAPLILAGLRGASRI